MLFDLAYVGSRGLHLTGSFSENTLDPKYLSLGTALSTLQPNPFAPFVSIGVLSSPTVVQSQLLLPYPQFLGVVIQNDPYGSSTYHSMQLKLVKRPSHGLTMLASFTWSKECRISMDRTRQLARAIRPQSNSPITWRPSAPFPS